VRFPRVLVVGSGQMGAGIAQVVAASGREVALYDLDPTAPRRALAVIERSLSRLAEKGGPEPEAVLSRIEPVGELVPAELMIEAVVEELAVKREVFARADALLPGDAVLASNTSSIPIGSLAEATRRPALVVGMHFFNPVPVLALVEVVRAPTTSAETAAAVTALARELGKEPIEARDLPGFVSNRILMPFINEAVAALEARVASAEAIDRVACLGFGHPMGPLALADLIGLDTCVEIMSVLERGLANPWYAPRPLLRSLVEAGRLGRKSGRGFYRYDAEGRRSQAEPG
jgi:3-hydroxybutyryl-CoA dehydrogenase